MADVDGFWHRLGIRCQRGRAKGRARESKADSLSAADHKELDSMARMLGDCNLPRPFITSSCLPGGQYHGQSPNCYDRARHGEYHGRVLEWGRFLEGGPGIETGVLRDGLDGERLTGIDTVVHIPSTWRPSLYSGHAALGMTTVNLEYSAVSAQHVLAWTLTTLYCVNSSDSLVRGTTQPQYCLRKGH